VKLSCKTIHISSIAAKLLIAASAQKGMQFLDMEAIEQVALSIKQLQLPASERVVDSPPCGRTAKREHLPVFPLEAMLKVTQPCSPAQPLHHQAGAAENHASGVEVVILPLSRLSEMDLLTGHGKSKRSPFARLILARENRISTQALRHLPTIRKASRTPSPLRLNANSVPKKQEPRGATSLSHALLAEASLNDRPCPHLPA